ncbi:MAG: patatin-like phospholipase family protein [Planctomycetota bacterium]|jgi:predicted acylesterase/phospholipase RssA
MIHQLNSAKHLHLASKLVRRISGFCLFILCSISACLSISCAPVPPINERLETFDPQQGYRFTNPQSVPENSDQLLVVLAFSGGGTRAAALSYGVMQQLKNTNITLNGEERPLTDEIDIISSVSGGSFTSAYFALFGDELFNSYEEKFLKRKVRKRLLERLFSLGNIMRLIFGRADRSDIAFEYYNKHIFQNLTFEDLLKRESSPFIIINATDMTLGLPFEFTQDQFDLLYSDLSRLPVAAAVTASSAFPFAFNPVTLKNYPKPIPPDFETPQWIEEDLKLRSTNPRRFRKAHQAASYIDHCRRKYIHLIDGGVGDNLGVYSALNALNSPSSPWNIQDLENVRQIIVIAVNSQNDPMRSWDQTNKTPNVVDVAKASIHGFMDNFTFESLALIDEKISAIPDSSTSNSQIKTYVIEIGFDYIEDDDTRRYFNNIATDLMLPEDQVDCLMYIGAWLLRNSEKFQQLVGDLNGHLDPVDYTLPSHACHMCDDNTIPPTF